MKRNISKVLIVMVIIILGTFFVPKESNDVYAVESPKEAILYKDNGNYYIVCTQDNTEYEEIQRDREYYFRMNLDCELIVGSIFTFYVTDEYGQRKDSFTFACRDDNYDFNHKMDMAYIPISSLINRQQGKFKIYYKVAMSNGSLLRDCKNVFHLNLLAEYEVQYNANGGLGAPLAQPKYKDSLLSLSDAIPRRTGYSFVGWSTNSNDRYSMYQPGDYYSGNSSIVLYAIWKADLYRLTYNPMGGILDGTQSKYISYDAIYGELPTPARTGYTFAGWYTAGSGGNRIISSSVVTSVSNHTLYAHWTPKQYTVTYNANGGKVSGTSKSITYGSTYGTLPVPVRTGCTFTGWYTAKSGGAKVTSQSVVKSTADQILYAQWKANTYTVNYQANGGKVTKTSGKIVYGSTYGTLPVPTRAGYTFTGWYTAKSGGTKITAKSIMKTAKNHTLYAHWKVIPPAGVTLKAKLKSANAVTLSWKKVSGAKGYEVYRATSPKGTYKRCKVLTSRSKTTYTDQKLSGGKTYYYKVRAYKTSGSKKVYGSYSKIVKKLVRGRLSTPKLAKPKSFKIGEPMTLQWNRIKNADKIEIYYNKNGGTYKKTKTVSGKSVRATIQTGQYNWKKGNIYRFRIRAYYREDGVTVYSDYSNSWGIGRK